MQLLMFNLVTDTEDPVLGFTTTWIHALAKKVDTLHVLTMYSGTIDVPSNVRVYSVGREKGYCEARRLINFYCHLLKIVHENHISGCFSHMIPVFSSLAAPILRPLGIPIVTWYAHPSLTTTLKIAHYASNHMVSSVPNAYPYKTDKLIVIGQGIDNQIFSPNGGKIDEPPMILCVGRLSAVKDHPTLLKAIAKLREYREKDFQVIILGQPSGANAATYIELLHQYVKEMNLVDIVKFHPPVPMKELPSWYRRCTVHVNLTPSGFGDKVAWEAMSCGRPCLVANKDFGETLGIYEKQMLFRYQDSKQLSERLQWVLALSEQERSQIGDYLRQQVVSLHSIEQLTNKIVAIIQRYKK
jgi:glycosyltransferase involved in cell wall biosynthesis